MPSACTRACRKRRQNVPMLSGAQCRGWFEGMVFGKTLSYLAGVHHCFKWFVSAGWFSV